MGYRHNKVCTKDLDLEKENIACKPIVFAILLKILCLYLDSIFCGQKEKKKKGFLERTVFPK